MLNNMSNPDQSHRPPGEKSEGKEMPETHQRGPTRSLPKLPPEYIQSRPSGTTEYMAILPDDFFNDRPELLFENLLRDGRINIASGNPGIDAHDQNIIDELRKRFILEYGRILAAAPHGMADTQAYQKRIKIQIVGQLIERVKGIRESKRRNQERLNPLLDTRSGMTNKLRENLHILQYIEVKPGKKIYLVQIAFDLDDFRTTNNIYGHLIGDEVLKKTGQAMLNSLRPEDGKAHYSGDEFGALLIIEVDEDASNDQIDEQIKTIIKRTIKNIQTEVGSIDTIDGTRITQELSVGYTIIGKEELQDREIDDTLITDITSNADTAARDSKIIRIAEENREERKGSKDRIVKFGQKLNYSEEELKDAGFIWRLRREFAERYPSVQQKNINKTILEMMREMDKLS